jgi:bacterioferritin-associated ferredoxin
VELDDEVCLCFHVTKRKLINFVRVERPRRAAQLSECFGAGTGCGWCRTYLTRLFEEATQNGASRVTSQRPTTAPDSVLPGEPALETPGGDEPTADDYARRRAAYVRSGGGTPPPGATPIQEAQD